MKEGEGKPGLAQQEVAMEVSPHVTFYLLLCPLTPDPDASAGLDEGRMLQTGEEDTQENHRC